jgi:hypothetical protein
LVASPTNCVEFVEERKAGNEFGFLIRTLKSRAVVKNREENSAEMQKSLWFAEVKASMLAHLHCAMEMVELCDAVRVVRQRPIMSDYKSVAAESADGFNESKRRLSIGLLIQTGDAVDGGDAMRLLGQ